MDDISEAPARPRLDQRALDAIPPALEAAVARNVVSGMVTLIWHRGSVVQLNAIGRRDVAGNLPMEADTIFRIASMTKPVTSAAALMLVEEGKLRLDDPIARWLPEFSDMKLLASPDAALTDTRPAARPITVEDLLTHRAGLAYGFSATGELAKAYAELDPPFVRTIAPDVWLQRHGALPLIYAPGERMHYSQATDVLGFLIARIEGTSLGELLRTRIFEPLGMVDTAFHVPEPKQHRLAKLYMRAADGSSLQEIPLPVSGSAPVFEGGGEGLFSTAGDYLKFARMLLGRGEIDGVRLLKPETVDLMASNHLTPAQRAVDFLGLPYWESMGFGLGLSVVMDPAKHEQLGAAGQGTFGWPGAFGTWWQADPENDMILIWLIQNYVDLSAEAVVGAQEVDPAGVALVDFQKQVYAALG